MTALRCALIGAITLLWIEPFGARAASAGEQSRCAQLAARYHQLAASPLEVQPVTVRFERLLDMDNRNEHAQLTMFFYFKNTSEHAITQIIGQATLKTASIERSESEWTWGLKPNSGRNEPVDIPLKPGNQQDTSLANTPLDHFTISWVTECVVLDDGSMYFNPHTER